MSASRASIACTRDRKERKTQRQSEPAVSAHLLSNQGKPRQQFRTIQLVSPAAAQHTQQPAILKLVLHIDDKPAHCMRTDAVSLINMNLQMHNIQTRTQTLTTSEVPAMPKSGVNYTHTLNVVKKNSPGDSCKNLTPCSATGASRNTTRSLEKQKQVKIDPPAASAAISIRSLNSSK